MRLIIWCFSIFLVTLFALATTDGSINIGDVESAKISGASVTADSNGKQYQFQAEVSRLMDIIINSLYSNRDVFLRELISNASDALDKIRFLALSNPKILTENDASRLEIKVRANKDAGVLEIIDSGLGMTKEDLIQNLGTIAKSGTSAFLKKAAEAKDTSNLIGQFGVGFYSAYLVSDRVTVTTKHYLNSAKQYVWESNAEQTFTISEDSKGEQLLRGTKISLHLKDDAKEFLEEDKLKELIKRYSQFINFPIYLETTEEVDIEVKDEAKEKEEDTDVTENTKSADDNENTDAGEKQSENEEDDITVSDDDASTSGDKKPTVQKEQRKSWTLVNENKPIWTRDASDISEEEYERFYEGIAKLPGKPIARAHFKGEGDVEFRSILYIPDRPPVGLYSGNTEDEKDAIKLYVRRVLVTDKFEYALLPRYLGFLVGIVDSDDIPINVSREMLQQSKTLDVIKRKLVRKALEMIRSLMRQDEDNIEKQKDKDEDKEKKEKPKSKYIEFWNRYGKSIKLGIIEDNSNRARIAKLLRFRSSVVNTDDQNDWASLDEYMSRMKKDQDHIYYHSGADLATVRASPFLEKLLKKGYEVLYLTEPIDEHMIMSLPDYEGTKFMSISKDNFKFGEKDQEEEKTKTKTLKKKFKPLTKFLKKNLGDKVSKVKISNRLSESVCVLSTDQYGYSARMEIIMKAQAFADPDSFSYMTPKAKVMELNPHHGIVKEMLSMVVEGKEEERTAELGHLIYDTALISSGYLMQDNADYSKRMYKWIGDSVGVDSEAAVVEEFPDEEDEEADTEDAKDKKGSKDTKDSGEGYTAPEEKEGGEEESKAEQVSKDEL